MRYSLEKRFVVVVSVEEKQGERVFDVIERLGVSHDSYHRWRHEPEVCDYRVRTLAGGARVYYHREADTMVMCNFTHPVGPYVSYQVATTREGSGYAGAVYLLKVGTKERGRVIFRKQGGEVATTVDNRGVDERLQQLARRACDWHASCAVQSRQRKLTAQ